MRSCGLVAVVSAEKALDAGGTTSVLSESSAVSRKYHRTSKKPSMGSASSEKDSDSVDQVTNRLSKIAKGTRSTSADGIQVVAPSIPTRCMQNATDCVCSTMQTTCSMRDAKFSKWTSSRNDRAAESRNRKYAFDCRRSTFIVENLPR